MIFQNDVYALRVDINSMEMQCCHEHHDDVKIPRSCGYVTCGYNINDY